VIAVGFDVRGVECRKATIWKNDIGDLGAVRRNPQMLLRFLLKIFAVDNHSLDNPKKEVAESIVPSRALPT
jgi:hypothetical protein